MAVREEEDAASLAVGRDEVVDDDPRVLRDAPAKHTHLRLRTWLAPVHTAVRAPPPLPPALFTELCAHALCSLGVEDR